MESCVGKETVPFCEDLNLRGKVENYLQDVIDMMIKSLNVISAKSFQSFNGMSKEDWIRQDPAQVTILINLVNWVKDVEKAFG